MLATRQHLSAASLGGPRWQVWTWRGPSPPGISCLIQEKEPPLRVGTEKDDRARRCPAQAPGCVPVSLPVPAAVRKALPASWDLWSHHGDRQAAGTDTAPPTPVWGEGVSEEGRVGRWLPYCRQPGGPRAAQPLHHCRLCGGPWSRCEGIHTFLHQPHRGRTNFPTEPPQCHPSPGQDLHGVVSERGCGLRPGPHGPALSGRGRAPLPLSGS